MSFLRACCLSALLLSGQTLLAADKSKAVQLTEGDGKTINVTVGGKPFTTFNYGSDLPKPFFSPVRGPDGTVLTRKIAGSGEKLDHPHHKGIWVAVDEVNKVKFWKEDGQIKNVSVKIDKAKGDPAVMTVTNHWLNESGEPVVTEKSTIRIFSNRVVEYSIKFIAEHGPVAFEDTKEGLFGFRMVDSMRENEGGHVVTSEGVKGTKAAWGKPAKWIDYYGEVEGDTFGVTIFDHPKNFRPSRYHVRNYGLFSINPWGEKAYAGNEVEPTELEKGESLMLRYAMYIHAGDTQAAKVAETYENWLKTTW